ncbi:MAG: hypothetical protein ACTSVZ_03400 [Promethearchaeota archaeon]
MMSQYSGKLSTESSNALQTYGRAMYQYAVAQWISLALTLISVFISMGIMVQSIESFVENMYLDDPNRMGFVVGQVLTSIIVSAVSIYMLVRYIQYLMRLKSAAEIVQDPNLQAHYKNEIRAIIVSVSTSIVAVIMIFILIQQFIANINELDGMETMSEAEFSSTMLSMLMPLMLWLLIVVALGILTLIFRIISVLKLDEWAEGLQHYFGPTMRPIKEGTNLIKWGRIAVVIPILNYVAGIIFLVGLTKAGKAIQTQFGDGAGNSPGLAGMGGSLETSYMPSETFRPTVDSNKCPFCGAPIPEQGAGFCAMCGKKLG